MVKIHYTIHEENYIEIPEDEEFKQLMEDYGGDLQGFAEAEVSDRTRYFNSENITINSVARGK